MQKSSSSVKANSRMISQTRVQVLSKSSEKRTRSPSPENVQDIVPNNTPKAPKEKKDIDNIITW
jgi:hypothetical protein